MRRCESLVELRTCGCRSDMQKHGRGEVLLLIQLRRHEEWVGGGDGKWDGDGR